MAYPISNSISKSTVNTFFKSLTGKTGHTQGAFLDMDYEIKYDGKKYVLKNDSFLDDFYTPQYIVAVAKNMGFTNTEIAEALNKTGTLAPDNKKWTNKSVRDYNIASTAGGTQLQKYLDANFSELKPYVSTISPDGNSYKTRIVFTDPKTGKKVYNVINEPANRKSYTTAELASIATNTTTPLGTALANVTAQAKAEAKAEAAEKEAEKERERAIKERERAEKERERQEQEALQNKIKAAQGSLNLSNAALAALQGNVGSGANAYQDMSAADRAAVTAKLPGTSGLTAYNKLNGVDIVPNITGNQDISGTIQRRALAELMSLGDQVLDEDDAVRQRNIKTQQAALLKQIQQDPELYNALVQRFRADSAAGVTAGQRAANAGAVVNESKAGYTEAAQGLYDTLFKPDGEIAKTRDEALSTQQAVLDQYITGQLNNAHKDAMDAVTQSTDLKTAVDALSEVFGVDVSKYANDILESSAAADTKASDILARIAGNSQTTLANQDAALQQILNTYNLGNNLASTGASGSTDVSSALNVIMQALKNPASTGAGFKTVSTPDYEKAEQFNNQQYNDVLNSEYMDYLDPKVIKQMGSSKSLDDILSEYGLDMLSEEGLKTLYTQYAEDANKRSDQVFNAAQRAYIAAITAGDVKTSEQLTRLAQSASGSRSNLYAAEALANQFRQQRSNANIGLQMATDVQNQRSANANAVNKAALQANSALSGYLGTGADGYDKSTLYAIGSLWDQAAATNRQNYGTLSNSIMQGVQSMNTQNVQNSVNNANRLAQLAAGITSANAAAAANNAANTASRNTAITQAQASKTQAERDLEKLTKLK